MNLLAGQPSPYVRPIPDDGEFLTTTEDRARVNVTSATDTRWASATARVRQTRGGS